MVISLQDYHFHTVNSGDASGSIEDACLSAISKGIKHICITEHLEFEPTDICYGAFNYAKFIDEFKPLQDKYSTQLELRHGVEVDYQLKYLSEIEDYISANSFDYILGSVHFLDGVPFGEHQKWYEGKNFEDVYGRYFQKTLELINTGLFDSVSHIDMCKRFGVKYYGCFDPKPLNSIIDEVLTQIIAKDMGIEINTSGLRQLPVEMYPCDYIISRYRELGGVNLTIGSDGHLPAEIGCDVDSALQKAVKFGYKTLDVFENRNRRKININGSSFE